MLLIACTAVAGAHHPALRIAARSDADTALSGMFKRAMIAGEYEVLFRLVGFVRNTVPQILNGIVHPYSIGELAGIHAVVGVPNLLELAKRPHKFRAKHLRKQRGARLAIAVLA